MKTIKNLLLGLTVAAMMPAAAEAQNCADFFNSRTPAPTYRYNQASKSATCYSGSKYKFVLEVAANVEYRVQFYASPVFNNEVQVKIVEGEGNVLYDLPGKIDDGEAKKGTTCLQDYSDPKTNKLVHPYFDFTSQNATRLTFMIDIKEHMDYQEEPVYDEWGTLIEMKKKAVVPEGGPEKVKGCFTVYIVDKPVENGGSF
jgi:hypothetical protein